MDKGYFQIIKERDSNVKSKFVEFIYFEFVAEDLTLKVNYVRCLIDSAVRLLISIGRYQASCHIVDVSLFFLDELVRSRVLCPSSLLAYLVNFHLISEICLDGLALLTASAIE